MQLGFVNFSQEEKNKMYQVMQAIREHQAIDELGLGRIRDAFANMMFPGMSTLHNRAKYYAVLPSLYLQAEKGHYKNTTEVQNAIIDLEIKLTRQLLIDNTDDNLGITGSTVIDKAEHDRTKYVKYDPSYIYWGALTTYGMVKSSGSLYQLILERTARKNIIHSKSKKNGNEEEFYDEGDKRTGDYELFDGGGLNYVFDGRTSIPISLTYDEATFIKDKIEKAEASKKSLLASLLRNNIPVESIKDEDTGEDKYLTIENIWKQYLSDEHYTIYVLSARFSRFQYLLRLLYNYKYYKNADNEDAYNAEMSKFNDKLVLWKDEMTTDKIDEVLTFIEPFVKDSDTIKFCRETSSKLFTDYKEVINLIVKREKETKGSSRSKLSNPNDCKKQGHTEAYYLDYRWGLVSSVINEIRKGLQNG